MFCFLLSCSTGAQKNILKNGDFSSHPDGKSANWLLSPAETGAITLDAAVAGDGKNALKISHQSSDSYSSVRQLVTVIPNSKYLFTLRIKTDNVNVTPGAGGARAFIGDVKGNTVAPGNMFAGTTQWQDVQIEFSTGENTQVQIFLYLHKASGTVWFTDIGLKALASEVELGANLVKNTAFVLDGEKLKEWSVSEGEPDAVSKASNSLLITHQKASYSSVRQIINVEKNSSYLATVRMKAQAVASIPGGAGARLFIGDEKGNTISASTSMLGTSDWQEVSVAFSSGEHTKVNFMVYLHQSTGTISIEQPSLIKVERQATEVAPGTPLRLAGTVYSRVYYSPESSLVTNNYLQMYGALNLGKASLNIYTCYEGKSMGFQQQPSRKFAPYINFMALRLNGKLHPAMQANTTTIGYTRINYSPYVASINYDYGAQGQGIAVENIKLKQYDLSAFNIFEVDSSKRYSSVGQGIRVRGDLGPWKAEIIGVRHLNGNNSADSSGNIIAWGSYFCDEYDLQYNFQRQLGNSMKINLLRVEQNKYVSIKKQTIAQKIDLAFSLGRYKNTIGYRHFEPGFAPRYRSKIPRVESAWIERLLSWNPADRYANQKGISLETMGSLWGKQFDLLVDTYCLLPEERNRQTKMLANLKGPLNLGLIYSWNDESTPSYSEISLRRELANNAKLRMHGELRSLSDAKGNNNDLNFKGRILELALDLAVKSGFFTGFNFQTGIKRADGQNYYYVRIQVALFGSFHLTFACRSPQVEQSSEFWFDDFDRLHFRDQYFSLKTSVSF